MIQKLFMPYVANDGETELTSCSLVSLLLCQSQEPESFGVFFI